MLGSSWAPAWWIVSGGAPAARSSDFEFGPGLFDGVQVRGVGRRVQHRSPAGMDPLAYAIDLVGAEVVGAEIVHDDHMAGAQLGAQHLVQKGEKTSRSVAALTVMAAKMPVWSKAPGIVRIFHWPPGALHRAHAAAPGSSIHPCHLLGPCHLRVYAAFVQVDQIFRNTRHICDALTG